MRSGAVVCPRDSRLFILFKYSLLFLGLRHRRKAWERERERETERKQKGTQCVCLYAKNKTKQKTFSTLILVAGV